MILINRTIVAFFLISLILSGCSSAATISPTPKPPVSTQPVYSANTGLRVRSLVVPVAPEAELAFITSGYVKSVNVKVGDTVKAGDILAQLDTVVLVSELARAESAVKAAKAEYEYRKKLTEAPLLVAAEIPRIQAAMELAAANIALAESEMVVAQNLLKQATLTAPFGGTILDVQIVPGEMVYIGKMAITIADLETFQIETIDLSEIDIPQIYIGQPVSIYIDALSLNIKGVVIKISPQSTLLGENRVYKVTIQINSQPDGLRWGMTAEANFIVDK